MEHVDGDVRAYLFGTARKLTAQYFRRKRLRPDKATVESLDDLPAEAPAGDSQRQVEQLMVLLEQLTPKAREAIRLRYLAGMRPKEAARHVGCSENVFYQRVHAALETLRVHVASGSGLDRLDSECF
jgi:RNA polymerase sigma-70 factor (ECF subfamily)